MNEPSVLDFVKAKLMPWKYKIEELDTVDFSNSMEFNDSTNENQFEKFENAEKLSFIKFWKYKLSLWPWYFLFSIFFAILGQILLEPPNQKKALAATFYIFSGLMMIFSIIRKDSIYTTFKESAKKELKTDLHKHAYITLILSFFCLIIGFFTFKVTGLGDIRFNSINLFFWLVSLALFCYAVLDTEVILQIKFKIFEIIKLKKIEIIIKPWSVLFSFIVLIVIFYRFFRLDMVLGEMFSDHAEKLLDVYDILHGDFYVFFVRNTGREFFQFYLTALIAQVFNSGVSFMSLKIGTALAGFFTLPFIYKLGNEIGNKWVGLIAFFLAGISYWGNLISRVGLRFPLYPLFAAPALFYLVRGLRQKRRNDFVLSGIAIGLGLHGYSPTRFLPIVILVGFILFWLHSKNKGYRFNTVFGLTMIVIISFIVFLPLFKFTLINPEAVSYRALTRLGTTERMITEPVYSIFLKNILNAEMMFFLSNGNTWVHSIPFRPALDFISAAFYFIGTIIVVIRYIKLRNWEDLFLLLSVPLLMMPSILSLAFPEENPSLNRTGGAIIPVFIIAAIGFEGLFRRLIVSTKSKTYKSSFVLLAISLLFVSMVKNYDLVFNQFNQQFLRNAWNSSQIGAVINGFSESIGDANNAFVVPSAHWVDTRLVGIVAGYPTRDFALWPDQFSQTLSIEDQKLFILKPENVEGLQLLQKMYPDHSLYNYDSGREGKDFLIFSVPAKIAPSQ